MNGLLGQRLRIRLLIATLVFGVQMSTYAESIPVRHLEGTLHGFVELRSADGKVLATGDLVQVAHGARVTSHMLFRFTDGSVDDETTVFSQRRSFQLIADRHVQKGPFFPHPMDLSINSRTSEVTVRTAGKDGKEEVITEHVKLPSDLANGIVPLIIKNIPPDTKETRVSIVVATPKPRIVQLAISPRGEEPFSLVGFPRSAMHYEIQIELGGVAGIVAPLVGKAPPKLQAWIVGGEAPVLVREDGPIYQDGPTLSIELASPTWPNLPRSGD